jgi:hypothetical protein
MTQFNEVLYVGIDIDRIAAEMDAEDRRRELNRVGNLRRGARRGSSSWPRNSTTSIEIGPRAFELDELQLPIAGIRVA